MGKHSVNQFRRRERDTRSHCSVGRLGQLLGETHLGGQAAQRYTGLPNVYTDGEGERIFNCRLPLFVGSENLTYPLTEFRHSCGIRYFADFAPSFSAIASMSRRSVSIVEMVAVLMFRFRAASSATITFPPAP